MSDAWHLRGRLDVAALDLALAEVIRRHQVLRTTFVARGGSPRQRVGPPRPRPLLLVDLSGFGAHDRQRARPSTRQLLAREARRPFDLERGPLIRGLLLRLAADEHIFAVYLHHIVSDGWSQGILDRELGVLYAAGVEGRPAPLAPLPLQYADFALQQKRRLTSEHLADDLAWWRRHLADVPLLELPLDRPRSRAAGRRAAAVDLCPAAGLDAALHELGHAAGTTLFMTTLAVFMTLLARYSGQHDVVVGTPTAGRDREEIEDLIGFFVNNLVLRGDLSGCPHFREVLKRVRELAIAGYSHQEVPFERLVEELAPPREAWRHPLFQVSFAIHDPPSAATSWPGIERRPASTGITATRFDLELYLWERAGELHGFLVYDPALFDPTTARRMARHFERLLASVAAAPSRPLDALEMLTPAESHQLCREWQGPPGPALASPCLHRLFERQARKTPAAVAVESAAGTLTYRELDRRANRLARHLRRWGAGPEDVVALFLERSPALVVAVLAVLKAGAAYLPLERRLPGERRAAMTADAAVRLVVTRAAADPPSSPAELVCLERDAAAIAAQSPEPPAVTVGADHAAYVLYTSGSSGRPKGVAVSHGAVARYLDWVTRACRDAAAAQGGVPLHSGLGFDLTVTSLFGPLLSGHRVVLLPEEDALDALASTLRERRDLTFVKLTPTHLEGLRHSLDEARIAVPMLIVGGEALRAESLAFWYERAGVRRVLNEYGPTEAVVGCVVHELAGSPGPGPVPIGRPIPGVRIHLCDAALRPVPIGVTGEILVAGPGLARGYVNEPRRTAAAFVPDPFVSAGGEAPSGRLYRTGDLARLGRDGCLEFLGRRDHQVKIRGFRVEPGEIEAVLRRDPAVREAVALALASETGSQQLVAYVVTSDGSRPAKQLRQALERQLPDYMVPAFLVFLDALPLTASGKIDRGALPAPDEPSTGPAVRPRTAAEHRLSEIWSAVLGRRRIHVHDNFFELGGHSLLATQVISRVRRAFCREVPLRLLFEKPTIAGLAIALETPAAAVAASPIVPVPRVGVRPPLSFAQERLWFLHRLDPDSTAYSMPEAWRFEGRLDVAALEGAWHEIQRRHEVLRTVFPHADGRPWQRIRALSSPLPQVDLSALDDAAHGAARRLLARAIGRPFDLARGPLLRGLLLRLAALEHVLFMNVHHVVSDGWSRGIFARELGTLYGAAAAGRPSSLAALPIQYADFAIWQRRYLRGEIFARELAYWRRQLAGLQAPELPSDRPRSSRRGARGGTCRRVLPESLTRSLKDLGRASGATLYMTLVAVLLALFHRLTGQTDQAVGTALANRTRPEIEGLIGFFVNTLVLRVDLGGRPLFPELLRRVRQVSLEAYAHQDLPFEKVVADLNPHRDVPEAPLFRAMVALQNAPEKGLRLPSLAVGEETVSPPLDPPKGTVSSLALEGENTHFDLSVFFWESGGELTVMLTYSRDLFEPTTAERLAGQLAALAADVVKDPRRPLDTLSPLDRAERRQIVAAARGRGSEDPAQRAQPRRPAAAHSPVETVIAGMLAELLELADVDVRADFFDLGGHSILAMQWLAKIERHFGVDLPLAEIFRRPTVVDLARLVEERDPGTTFSPLVEMRPASVGPEAFDRPFYCVHPAAGHVMCFADLARRMEPGPPFYGIEAPRHGSTLPVDLAGMAARYVDAVLKHQDEGPYLLGGYSMGGVVAFEMAQQLEESGREVAFLAILDAVASSGAASENDADGWSETDGLELFARDLGLENAAELARARADRALPLILEAARRQGTLGSEVDLGRLRRLYEAFKGHVDLLRHYSPRPYGGKVHLFRPRESRVEDPANGWRHLAAAGVEIVTVPGDHFNMIRTPQVETLAERLRDCLPAAAGDRVIRRRPRPGGR